MTRSNGSNKGHMRCGDEDAREENVCRFLPVCINDRSFLYVLYLRLFAVSSTDGVSENSQC